MRPDPYAVLKVARDAPMEVINAAYRALAKLHHPDVNGQTATGRMAEINDAYETLCDPARRRAVDATLPRDPRPEYEVMPFGKHRGQEMGSVPVDYLLWAARNVTNTYYREVVNRELQRRGWR